MARGVFRRLGVQRPRRRGGAVHRGRHVRRGAVRRRVGRARRDRPLVDERRSGGRGVRLRGPCRRGRDRHRALERQGPAGGRAAPRRMGRHPADHVRAGRALSRSPRVARPPGAARTAEDVPNAHVRSDVALQHVSRLPAEQEPAGRRSDHRTTRHDRSRNTTAIGVRIPNVWTDRHRSNSIAASGPGVTPRSPRVRSRPGGRGVRAPSRATRADDRERSHRGERSRARRHPISWAWQDSNPRHEG